jgi:hypothetical protein
MSEFEAKQADAIFLPPVSPTSTDGGGGGGATCTPADPAPVDSTPADLAPADTTPPEAKQVLTDIPLSAAVTDPLIIEFRQQLALVVDIKHLNASNLLSAVTKGMQVMKNFKTKTNEQKKILLLQTLALMITESDLSQDRKSDLIWVVDEMGPSSIELFLFVADKGSSAFKNTSFFKNFSWSSLKCCC